MQGSDKRRAERAPVFGELRGDMMVFQPMLVKNISSGGITIETPFPLVIDSLHDVRLTLGNRSLVFKGRVIHSRVSDVSQNLVAYSTGLELVDPSPSVSRVIEEFLGAAKADNVRPTSP